MPGKRTLTEALPAKIYRHATSVAAPDPEAMAAVIRAMAAPGRPLPEALRRALEAVLHADLGAVRIHTSAASDEAAQAIRATAFTMGQNIHFANGHYDPTSEAGKRLVAHEVAHTLQSSNESVNAEQTVLSTPGDANEAFADEMADRFTSGSARQRGPAPVTAPAATNTVFRQQAPVLPLTQLAHDVETTWRSTNSKGRVFDLLRSRSPVTDQSLNGVLSRIFAAGTDDLWLAQTICRYGPEPLWPDAAVTERHRRQVDHHWDPEPGSIEATLTTTRRNRPVQAYFFPGRTDQRALVIGGVHGSEQGGIEVVEMLLADMRAAPRPPYYTVIIVPVLFPDNAATGSREGATPTNRNFPAPGTSLGGATGRDGVPRDATGRRILTENVAFMELVERFRPSRICTVHGTHTRESAGVFSDRHTVSSGARARARATDPGEHAAPAAAERSLDAAAAGRTAEDSALAIRMARGIAAADGGTHGNAVLGNHLDTTATSGWSGEVPGGTSLGGWGPQDVTEGGPGDRPSMSAITVEVPENHRSTDRRGRTDQARRLELLAFRDVIRQLFLEPSQPATSTP